MHFRNQFEWQHARAVGRILNVGCDSDSSGLKRTRGAVNVDIWTRNPWTGFDCPADVIADARDLPASLYGQFDTVILGDILEHFVEEADVLKVLRQAKRCLEPGRDELILISCPEDNRPIPEQVKIDPQMYTDGVRAYHAYPVTLEIIERWCQAAGLEIVQAERIDYEFCQPHGGHGIVAVPTRLAIPQKEQSCEHSA